MSTVEQTANNTSPLLTLDANNSGTDSVSTAYRLLSTLYPESSNFQGRLGITAKNLGFSVDDDHWFSTTAGGIAEAAKYAAKLGTDVYFHCASHEPTEAKRISRAKKEASGKPWAGAYRGQSDSAAQLPALYADIDLAEAEKETEKNYPSLGAAVDALNDLPIPPSIIVFSGNGLHVYWLFDTPVNAQEYRHLPTMWLELIKQQLVDESTGESFDIDSTGDLARILRVPGTINSKGGKTVKIIHIDETKRYNVSSIVELVKDIEISPAIAKDPNSVTIVLNPECDAPACLGNLKKSPKFRDIWEHKVTHLHDRSLSTYDMSIANYSAKRGCSDQEICDLLVTHRHEHGNYEKDNRPDYYQLTISKVRAGISKDKAGKEDLFGKYAYVLSEKRFYDRETLQDMDKEQFADKTARILGSRKAPNEFLESTDTLLLDSVTYLVNGDEVVEENSLHKLNIWDGYTITPRPGDVEIFTDHIDYLFGTDDAAKNHMLDVMAHHIQRPEQKILHAPLIIGPEGIGKSVLGAIEQRILGPGNVRTIDNTELNSDYNDWIRNTALVIVEELMTLGRKELMNKLKPLITQPEVRIQRKYVPTITLQNRTNFMFFSNYTDAALLDKGDRRHFVHISTAVPESQAYYDRLWKFINSDDGIAAIAHYLHSRDLSKFNPNSRPPMTVGKELVIQESRSPIQATLHMLYDEEQAPFDKDLVSVKDIISTLNINTLLTRSMRGISPKVVSQFLRDIGAKNLGQKRIAGGKPRLWAIRRKDIWSQASEKMLDEHINPRTGTSNAQQQVLREVAAS